MHGSLRYILYNGCATETVYRSTILKTRIADLLNDSGSVPQTPPVIRFSDRMGVNLDSLQMRSTDNSIQVCEQMDLFNC